LGSLSHSRSIPLPLPVDPQLSPRLARIGHLRSHDRRCDEHHINLHHFNHFDATYRNERIQRIRLFPWASHKTIDGLVKALPHAIASLHSSIALIKDVLPAKLNQNRVLSNRIAFIRVSSLSASTDCDSCRSSMDPLHKRPSLIEETQSIPPFHACKSKETPCKCFPSVVVSCLPFVGVSSIVAYA
jgi:hypothetical protein